MMLGRVFFKQTATSQLGVRLCSAATEHSGLNETLSQSLGELSGAGPAEFDFPTVRTKPDEENESSPQQSFPRRHQPASEKKKRRPTPGDSVIESAKREVQFIDGRSKMDMSQKERLTLKEFRKFTSGINARTSWYKQCSREELEQLANNLLFYVDDMGERNLTWSIYEFAKLKYRNDRILTALGERFTEPRRLQMATRQNLCYTLFGFAQLGYDNHEIINKVVQQLASSHLMYNYRKDHLLMIAAALHRMKWSDVHVLTLFARECKVRMEQGKFKVNKQVAWLLDSTGVAKSHYSTRRKVVLD
ncbi:hypothetical protein BSKO_08503 [Bryopsis sp. KO-2023]|nr:hypothetical protein BSKO_08503 [Bryopsis sp. KO-2023]